MFDLYILWLWHAVMNNPVTFYKNKVVVRILNGGDAMLTSTAVSCAQRTNKLLLNTSCSIAQASHVSVSYSGRE